MKENFKELLFWGILYSVVLVGIFYIKWISILTWHNLLLFSYSMIVTSWILGRFVFASFYKLPESDYAYQPFISVVVPAYNEEKIIKRAVTSWLTKIDYPEEKYEVIVVNDGSKDKTWDILQSLQSKGYDNLIVDGWQKNQGKRFAQKRGFDIAKGEIIVIADSDSFPANSNALKEIVQPFRNPKVGGVCGHTDVYDAKNSLEKMQKVKYWTAFDKFKRGEAVVGGVICLSGCFSAIRKTSLDEIVDKWYVQTFLGVRATYGDDRALTTMLLQEGWKTVYAPKAKAFTVVPSTLKKYWKQQLRWTKSYIRETFLGSKFIWKRPSVAFQFYVGAILSGTSVFVAIYVFWFLPIFAIVVPVIYILGLVLVTLFYSINYFRNNKDMCWIWTPVYYLFYSAIMIWRYPIAITELKKTDWKTR